MITLADIQGSVVTFLNLGGPVVAVLLVLSVISLATILLKLWHFLSAGVGRRKGLERALTHWDRGEHAEARDQARKSRSHIRHVMLEAMETSGSFGPLSERLTARSEAQTARLESGFRLLDSIAQIAPLLGLFGTVLGMIEAFRQLQDAGSSVDPSLLAGGIWVALMTTAVGLAVAMPTALMLTWLESRIARDRVFADQALHMLLCPAEGLPDAA
ncbi:MAG: MotA/TolQ/ExbB proton channel family protein [Pseudomonadota bacterium]